jgi:hypothetical protein
MKHPILSRIPFLRQLVDERFLEHRRRASSTAGFVTVFVAYSLFLYRWLVDRELSWDLLAVLLVFAVVKTTLFFWYRRNY